MSGPDQPAIVDALVAEGLAPQGVPEKVSIGAKDRPGSPLWASQLPDKVKEASWPGGVDFITVDPLGVVKVHLSKFVLDVGDILPRLARVPFEVAAFGHYYPEWTLQKLKTTSFADGHFPHGWGCAFRGAGHDRLVSTRWLAHGGPWLLHQGPDRTSLVQFHAVDANTKTAWEQAKPGHKKMGISDVGGYLSPRHRSVTELKGLYIPEERLMKIIVHGRTVPPREMLDAVFAIRTRASAPAQPLSGIAYVFVQEKEAAAHLHDLWLHGLECRVVRNGVEVRDDLDYEPPPSRPAWA